MKLIGSLKTNIRVFYWTTFGLLMLLVIIPMFLFFYLFDEQVVKTNILNQFDHQAYSVVINGQIIPRLLHGFSIDINDVKIYSKNQDNLFTISRVNCKLSWRDLLFGKYTVKRVSINRVDINQNNIEKFGIQNLLNLTVPINSPFSNLENLDINSIRILYNNKNVINDGNIVIKNYGIHANIFLTFKVPASNSNILMQGNVANIKNQLISFDDFNVQLQNQSMNVVAKAQARYSILQKQLILNHVIGDVKLKQYFGKLDIANILIGLQGFVMQQSMLSLNLSTATDRISSALVIDAPTFEMRDYTKLILNSLLLKYNIGIPNFMIYANSMIKDVTFKSNNIMSTCNNEVNVIINNVQDNALNASLKGSCSYFNKKRQFNLNLKGIVDNGLAKLKVQVINQKKRPYIFINGNMANFDLSRVNFKNNTPSLFNNTDKLPFYWLELFDAKANLFIENLTFDKIIMNNVSTNLNINKANLDITKINADIYGGKLNGNFKISQKNNLYNIQAKQRITNLHLTNLLDDLFEVRAISGTGNVDLNINVKHVKSYAEVYRNLNGKVLIEATEGVFKGIDFNVFTEASNHNILTNKKSTIFKSMRANFTFKNGISNNGKFMFTSPYVIANGYGILNFVDNKLDYHLKIRSVLPKNEQKIGLVIIPVQITGAVFSPKITIQNINLIHQ